MRTSIQLLFVSLVLPAVATAQSQLHAPATFAPDQIEMSGYEEIPMTRDNARVQMFYDATELGSSSFTATGIALRFDGPIPQVGAPGPFTIQQLTVRIGTSTVIDPGPVFANNVGPTTTVFDQPLTYWPDQGSQIPAPWGGLNGGLNIPFSSPVPVTIPAGGWLVIDITVRGNSLNGATHAMLDGEIGGGGPVDGTATSAGVGCATTTGGTPATMTTTGVHAPGAAYSVTAQNLGANAPVLAVIGVSDTQSPFGALPYSVPSTPCSVYTSWDILLQSQTNAAGSLAADALTLPIPADPTLSGATLHHQLISLVPGANAPWNVVMTDKRTVQLGTLQPRIFGMYMVAHGHSATSPIADTAYEFGYAVQIHTQ